MAKKIKKDSVINHNELVERITVERFELEDGCLDA